MLEIRLNTAFKEYTYLYYSGLAYSSVYLWDLGESFESGFAGAIVIQNSNSIINIRGSKK